MIEIVSATRLSERDFWKKSALGISLKRLNLDKRLTSSIAFNNRKGLPDIYNDRIISEDNNSQILVFIHDDVWIDDYFLVDRVIEGLKAFDVIGVAGNRRIVPHQSSWAFIKCHFDVKRFLFLHKVNRLFGCKSDRIRNLYCLFTTDFVWDEPENLSGSVAHGKRSFGEITYFGTVPAECELMDGLFLAAKKDTLKNHNVYFDSNFDFHFYDLDFCKQARKNGLDLGTWPICLTHQSGGAYGSRSWKEKYRQYIEKWQH